MKKSVLDQKSLTEAFEELKISTKHIKLIWRYVIQNQVEEFVQIPGIPKRALELLNRDFVITTSKVVSRTDNQDKSTTKLLIELQSGQRVETVIMRYGDVALSSFPIEEKEKLFQDGEYKFKSNKRATLCVSSQVGCAMGCTFCATGTMNLLGNLSSGEILEQLYHANKIETIRNVVFMGMGEPLDNYEAVLLAVQGMVDTGRYALSPKRVTISTVGVVPRLISLKNDLPDVGLALSLHAPNQKLRSQIVPTAKAWHIDKIVKAANEFVIQQNEKITSDNRKQHILIEYVLIANVNDGEQVAHELGALLQGKAMLLNVIPYNPTSVPYDYKPPTNEKAQRFVDIVRNDYNVHTLFRQKLGQDIASACGQLVIDNACNNKIQDIEDMGSAPVKRTIVKKRAKSVNKNGSNPEKRLSQGYIVALAVLFLLLGLVVRKLAYGLTATLGGLFGYSYISDTRAGVYPGIILPALRLILDAEQSHALGIWLCKHNLVPKSKIADPPNTSVTIWGRRLSNPIGIAAGFDKNGEAINALFGFGFANVEIGSITPESQPGNPKPRVFRYEELQAVINRYGFNSDGMLVVLNRLLNLVRKDNGLLGVNLGKNKTSDADSDDDYVRGIANLGPFADYLVINISSPNTPGLRDLQHENSLFRLLSAAKETRDKLSNKPPLVVKIAPDVTLEELADIASVVEKVGIDGVIIGNTTLSRPIPELDEAGGLSGKPLLPLALKKVSEFYKLTQGRVPIIGCGGISTAQDALEFRKAGATLVQLYTSFVYNGPGVCNQIVSDLNNILTEKQTTWQNLHE